MKHIATLIVLLAISLGAVAQEDCPLPQQRDLSAQERQYMKKALNGQLDEWKKLGASGESPALTFKELDKNRISIAANYETDDSTVAELSDQFDFVRVATLYDAVNRLSDIFDMVATLGYGVSLEVTLHSPHRSSHSFSTIDNASLRRIMLLESALSVQIYADMLARQKEMPFEFTDSVMCTALKYCYHLWTLQLHSNLFFGPDDDPYLFWMTYCAGIVEEKEFLRYIGMDSTTVRFVIFQQGVKDTLTFDFTPAQLLGEQPLLDIPRVGTMVAQNINKRFPMPLAANMGTMERCTFDPALQVLVVDCLVEEITVISLENKENQVKQTFLTTMMTLPEEREFLESLSSLGLGLEYRMESRTTHRSLTITVTPDELRVFLLEHQ